MRLPASYSVEASYIMAIVLFSLVTGIKTAYGVRSRAASGFAVQEAAIEAVYTEKTWLDADPEEAGKAAMASLSCIGGMSSAAIDITPSIGCITAEYSGPDGEREIEIGLRDPENYIRLNVLVDLIKGDDEGGGDETLDGEKLKQ